MKGSSLGSTGFGVLGFTGLPVDPKTYRVWVRAHYAGSESTIL